MEITHADYQVHYDEATATITCQGSFRLRDAAEYQPILDLLTQAARSQAATVTLDVRGLRFLNSQGINTLAKFILLMRQQPGRAVIIEGNHLYPWQQKSLKNYQRLMPSVELKIV